MQTLARVYTSKTLVPVADLLYDRLLPFYEALGRKKLSPVVPKSVQQTEPPLSLHSVTWLGSFAAPLVQVTFRDILPLVASEFDPTIVIQEWDGRIG